MLLLRTAEFKPYCIFIKPPPLKELRTSRLTVQQAGKAERPSNSTNMRTFKVLYCCFKFTKRALWEWSFKRGSLRKVYLTHPYISLPSLVKHSILSNHYGACDNSVSSRSQSYASDSARYPQKSSGVEWLFWANLRNRDFSSPSNWWSCLIALWDRNGVRVCFLEAKSHILVGNWVKIQQALLAPTTKCLRSTELYWPTIKMMIRWM